MSLKYFNLTQIVENREALHSVSDWLDLKDFKASHFGYGVPERVLPILSKPINHHPTYTDLIVAVAKEMARPIHYLEIGVSVGKNIYVLSKVLKESILYGLDWEAINPRLAQALDSKGSSPITYIQGDEFKNETWTPLAGKRFDIIFSDASHEGPALLKEYQMIKSMQLLNPQGFFMLWDDLHPNLQMPMTAAFKTITKDMREQFGSSQIYSALLPLNGWLGQHEPAHFIGIATNLPWFNRDTLRAALQKLSNPIQDIEINVEPAIAPGDG